MQSKIAARNAEDAGINGLKVTDMTVVFDSYILSATKYFLLRMQIINVDIIICVSVCAEKNIARICGGDGFSWVLILYESSESKTQ